MGGWRFSDRPALSRGDAMRRLAARRTDPATSAWAAWQIEKSGKAGTQRRGVYRTILELGNRPFTAGEIAQAGRHDRYMVSRRLPELEELNLIRRGDPRLCRVMGSRQTTWRAIYF